VVVTREEPLPLKFIESFELWTGTLIYLLCYMGFVNMHDFIYHQQIFLLKNFSKKYSPKK